MRSRGLPFDFGPAFLIASQPQSAIHFPARGEARFLFQFVVKVDGIAQQLRNIGVRPQLPDQPRRMPGRARGQSCLFQQQNLLAHLREVIGGRAADDATTDDERFCRGGKRHGVSLSVLKVLQGSGKPRHVFGRVGGVVEIQI